MKYGRNFSKAMPGDEERVILKQAAIKRIGWTLDESVIGKKITSPDGEIQFEVIGIVEDFNYWTLEGPIDPMGIFHNKSKNLFGIGDQRYIALRVASQDSEAWKKTLSELNILWKTHAGDFPLQYDFVD